MSIVAQDIIPTVYIGKEQDITERDQLYINIGTNLSDYIFENISWSLGFDYIDIFKTSKQSIFKRIFLGGQLNFYDYISLLTGIHQGYPSYGVIISIFDGIKIEYATYTQERDEFLGERPNIRHSFHLKTGLNL